PAPPPFPYTTLFRSVSATAWWFSRRDRAGFRKRFAWTCRGRATSTPLQSANTPARSWPNWRIHPMKSNQAKRIGPYVLLFYLLRSEEHTSELQSLRH